MINVNLKMKNKFIFILSAMVICSHLHAQTKQVTTSTAKIPKSNKLGLPIAQNTNVLTPTNKSTTPLITPPTTDDTKSWGLYLSLENSSNLYEEDSFERTNELSLLMNPSYKVGRYKLSLKSVVVMEQTHNKDTLLTNTDVSLGFGAFNLSENVTLGPSIKYVIPTNKDAQEVDRMKGAVGASAKLTYKINESSLYYALSATRSFHDYTINGNGSPNIEYKLNHIVGTSLQLGKKFTIDAEGLYSTAQTYGNYKNYSFEASLDISYELSKSYSISVGTTNSGSALKADGKTSNISYYNEDSSTLRANLNIDL